MPFSRAGALPMHELGHEVANRPERAYQPDEYHDQRQGHRHGARIDAVATELLQQRGHEEHLRARNAGEQHGEHRDGRRIPRCGFETGTTDPQAGSEQRSSLVFVGQ